MEGLRNVIAAILLIAAVNLTIYISRPGNDDTFSSILAGLAGGLFYTAVTLISRKDDR